MNSDRYAYALGVFIMNMILDSDQDVLLFNPDVRAIHGAMFAKHAKETRLNNKIFKGGVYIGTGAYNACVNETENTTVTINATIRLIQMKHKDLIARVYKLDSKHFENLCITGDQNHTMVSVKIANRFLKILDDHYEKYMGLLQEQKKKKRLSA